MVHGRTASTSSPRLSSQHVPRGDCHPDRNKMYRRGASTADHGHITTEIWCPYHANQATVSQTDTRQLSSRALAADCPPGRQPRNPQRDNQQLSSSNPPGLTVFPEHHPRMTPHYSTPTPKVGCFSTAGYPTGRCVAVVGALGNRVTRLDG